MNADSRPPPSDPELDRLLASRLRRCSPEFEQRWRELRAELTRPVATPVRRWMPWFWPGLAAATLAAGAALFVLRPASPRLPAAGAVSFEDLLTLDAALAPAAPLLDAENREVLLYLPPKSTL